MKVICSECGKFKKHHAKGMCDNCYDKKYRANNKEKEKEYYAANKEKIKEQRKEYYAANKEKVLATAKKCRLNNPEKFCARAKEYRFNNPEKARAVDKKYYANNPGKVREYRLKRRGYGTPEKGIVTIIINENILRHGIITCEKCKEGCFDKYHIDHIIPLSKGGSNDYNNLQLLCAHCNLSKHITTADYRLNSLVMNWGVT